MPDITTRLTPVSFQTLLVRQIDAAVYQNKCTLAESFPVQKWPNMMLINGSSKYP